jgi:hypothetical protein
LPYTIDFVDIATGWTEQRAVWGKGEKGVLKQIKDVEKMLPFPLLGFDSDNGGEFLNYHLFRHFTHRKQPIDFTRSRAYHKDDDAPKTPYQRIMESQYVDKAVKLSDKTT